jgi:hypothetical protein
MSVYFLWVGRRVWMLPLHRSAPPLFGKVIGVSISPHDRQQISLKLLADNDTRVKTVDMQTQGTTWGFLAA